MIQWLDEVFIKFLTVIDMPLSLRQCSDIFHLRTSIVEQRPPKKNSLTSLQSAAINNGDE